MTTRSAGDGRTAAIAAALLVAVLAACSPEDDRRVGGGPGADPGNRTYPLPELHGKRTQNNPSANVPAVGQVPADAKGVPGFWADAGAAP